MNQYEINKRTFMNSSVGNYINEQLKYCGDQAFRSTCQLIYTTSEPGRILFKAIGSGVLIKYKDKKFIISAAHVLEPLSVSKMLIPNGQELITPNGNLITTQIPLDGDRKNDKIDLAILLPTSDLITTLEQRFHFLDQSKIDIRHEQLQSYQYMVCGYPISLTNFDFEETLVIKPTPTKLRCKITTRTDLYIPNYEAGTKWVLDYNRAKQQNVTTGEPSFGPEPKGISGGGLWSIPVSNNIPANQTNMELVGIMTDYFASGEQVLCATNINLIIAIIENRFF